MKGFPRWIKSSPGASPAETNAAGIMRSLLRSASILTDSPASPCHPDGDTKPEHSLSIPPNAPSKPSAPAGRQSMVATRRGATSGR
jgi:hypothetical protein